MVVCIVFGYVVCECVYYVWCVCDCVIGGDVLVGVFVGMCGVEFE